MISIRKGVLIIMNKEVMILVGAGQIGMAIARRMGLMWSIWKWIYHQENLLNLL